jgi:hypothetical protein
MPDLYIGGNVTMRITDEGYNVSFWILTDAYTFNHSQRWAWSDSGVLTFDMNNRGTWQLVGRVAVPGSRNIGWTIYNSGLGFPTSTISMYVSRATVPPAPTAPTFSNLTNVAVRSTFNGRGDGGSPITQWQLAYGTNPNGAQIYLTSGGINDLSGLTPGMTYYFWARGANAIGWGAWSSRSQVRMQNVPDAPATPVIANISQNGFSASFQGGYNGGQSVDQFEIAYGTDPSAPQHSVVSVNRSEQYIGSSAFTDLDPGKLYYVWARGHNYWGWSPYSARAQAQLIAGVLIPVAGTMRRAVPWVNDNGTWKLARPWGKTGGVWRTVSS